eukprot:scaffold41661_cov40-Phaeocystis_antarctica.AAC.1
MSVCLSVSVCLSFYPTQIRHFFSAARAKARSARRRSAAPKQGGHTGPRGRNTRVHTKKLPPDALLVGGLVQRHLLKRSSEQLKERWQVEILTSPLRLVSCSPAQPPAPALGLSAGAGLIPPVSRFAAAGRPASICSTARRAAKRRATRWRSLLWVRPLARQDMACSGHLEC